MASAFSHAIAAVSLGAAFPAPGSVRFWLYGIGCSVIPDLDVLGFKFGVQYEDLLGHRGLTHSIAFAVMLSGLATAAIARHDRGENWQVVWLYLFLATISHGLLDAFTNGGLGVAFFAPFVNERYFFPWQPIEVSPIGVSSFFSTRGLDVMRSEAVWIWMPAFAFALLFWSLRRMRAASKSR